MDTKENIKTIKNLYDEFNKGNIPAILEKLHDDIIFTDAGAPEIPYAGTYKGKKGVGDFFHKMNESVEVTKFILKDILGEGSTVAATGDFGIKSRKTGIAAETEWAMFWNFENGKPISFHSYLDTNNMSKAFK